MKLVWKIFWKRKLRETLIGMACIVFPVATFIAAWILTPLGKYSGRGDKLAVGLVMCIVASALEGGAFFWVTENWKASKKEAKRLNRKRRK